MPVWTPPQNQDGQNITIYVVRPDAVTYQQTASAGGDNNAPSWGDFDTRLREVEKAVSAINERFKHIPTKSDLWWYVFVGGIVPAVAAGWWIVQQIVSLHLGKQ